jgi:hypothetical protein
LAKNDKRINKVHEGKAQENAFQDYGNKVVIKNIVNHSFP